MSRTSAGVVELEPVSSRMLRGLFNPKFSMLSSMNRRVSAAKSDCAEEYPTCSSDSAEYRPFGISCTIARVICTMSIPLTPEVGENLAVERSQGHTQRQIFRDRGRS